MRNELCLGPVNHTDSTLQPRLREDLDDLAPLIRQQTQHECRQACVVAAGLIRAWTSRPYALDLQLSVPMGRRSDEARSRAEADERHLIAPSLARELANVVLPAYLAHLRRAGIANV